MTQIVEIEVDIPDGYMFDSFRIPHPGDLYIVEGTVRERKCDTSIGFPCVIVKKDWVWPDWLKAAYIAMDEDGEWYCYNKRPHMKADRWIIGDGSASTNCIALDQDMLRFSPPHCSDWTRSLRANPSYKSL